MIHKTHSLLLIFVLSACSWLTQTPETGVLGKDAMVVSAHPLASETGLEILRKGGNAFDATIATQFALAVVYPRAGNIGGGGFAVIRTRDGALDALDFRETAPMQASRNMYLDENGEVIEDLSTLGHLSVATPGSVAGMWQLHQKYGSLPWADLVNPAIDLAFEGFSITEDEANALNEKLEDFKKANRYVPWVYREEGWTRNDFIRQPKLAATLSFIRDSGRDGFYKGIVANQLVNEMEQGGGIITLEDLETYEAIWRNPIIGMFNGHRVISMPPPSSGGVALLQILQGAEQFNLGEYDHNSKSAIHLMAEIERRVYADRAKYLGDPDFVDVPVKELLNEDYNRERFATIKMESASQSESIDAGQLLPESYNTTHFSIVDPFGNAVSVTTTLNLNYGSKVMVEGAGFFLNNIMDDFSAKPGVPNAFGLVGAEANAIAPGKRMLSSMTPTIVEKDGELKMVVGTPGGATIITSVFQVILNVLNHEMTMQEAVNAKRVHHQWLPDQIRIEDGAIDEEVRRKLESMGHSIEITDKIGRTDCILIRADSLLEGGADHRGDDTAMGF